MTDFVDGALPEGEPGLATIPDLIALHAARTPAAAAIVAPERTPLSYGDVWRQIFRVTSQLQAWGIGREDRVALALPPGPELALACLCVSAVAVVTILNPDGDLAELEASLSVLRPRAMLVLAGPAPLIVTVASRRQITVFTLTPLPGSPAGSFELSGAACGPAVMAGIAGPDRIASVVYASEPASPPRVVPLTHRALCARALETSQQTQLAPTDRGLLFLPLAHVDPSLLLTAFVAGGSLVCPPAMTSDAFFTCLDECHPTWCQVVPATSRDILAGASRHAQAIAQHTLQCVRLWISSLSPQEQDDLEHLFGVPVFTAYRLLETGPIAHAPLPPRPNKAGSVGVIHGQSVAIVDGHGLALPPGQTGEIVVRGHGVFGGYEGDPEANRHIFRDAWLRTGDAGYLDEEGYLFLTGRFEEPVSQGIEESALPEADDVPLEPEVDDVPLESEVDDVPLEPEVEVETEVLALPSTTLNEVTAKENLPPAVVADLGEQSAVQVPVEVEPTVVSTVAALPAAADKAPLPAYVAPRDGLERMLAVLWAEVLGVVRVGADDGFFVLGGSSVHARELCDRVDHVVGCHVEPDILFEASTVALLARYLIQQMREGDQTRVVALQPQGERPPFFCAPLPDGSVLEYQDVARSLGPDQPVYGLPYGERRAPREGVQSLREIASECITAMRGLQAAGPYYLGGFSEGGLVAYEMAQQVMAAGQEVGLLVLFDTPCPLPPPRPTLERKVRHQAKIWGSLGTKDRLVYLREQGRGLMGMLGSSGDTARSGVADVTEPAPWTRSANGPLHEALLAYRPRAYTGQVAYFWAAEIAGREMRRRTPDYADPSDARLGWRRLVRGSLAIYTVPSSHGAMMRAPESVRETAARLQVSLGRAQSRPASPPE